MAIVGENQGCDEENAGENTKISGNNEENRRDEDENAVFNEEVEDFVQGDDGKNNEFAVSVEEIGVPTGKMWSSLTGIIAPTKEIIVPTKAAKAHPEQWKVSLNKWENPT